MATRVALQRSWLISFLTSTKAPYRAMSIPSHCFLPNFTTSLSLLYAEPTGLVGLRLLFRSRAGKTKAWSVNLKQMEGFSKTIPKIGKRGREEERELWKKLWTLLNKPPMCSPYVHHILTTNSPTPPIHQKSVP